MASQLIAAWQPTIDSFWEEYLKFNNNLSEADQAMERESMTQILTLTGQGQFQKAIIECGHMWQRENQRKAPDLKSAHGGDNHPVIWVLSRIYGSVKYPDFWDTFGNYCINPAFLAVQGMARDLPTGDRELLEAFLPVTVYWLSVKSNLMLAEATKFGTRLLSRIEAIPDFDGHAAASLRNALAITFLQSPYDGPEKPGISSDPEWNVTWTQKETVIREYLERKNEGHSANDETLRLFYSFIYVGLSHQPDDRKVVEDLLQLYHSREVVYNERHDMSTHFVEDLLEEFVHLMRKHPVPLATQVEHGFIYDLVDFCLSNKRYEDAQVLAQEFVAVPGRLILTDSSTNRQVFTKWRAPARTVQALLAQDGSPGQDYYWADSRLYTRSIGKIETPLAYPRDIFPKAPIKITITPNTGLRLEISDECLPDWRGSSGSQALSDLTQQVKCSEIWHLLERLNRTKDWRILLSLDLQSHHPMCQKRRGHFMEDSLRHEDIFEEEVVEAVADGQNIREPFTYAYRFLSVGDWANPSWMVLKFPQVGDADGNQSYICQHGDSHYANKQSYGYGGKAVKDLEADISRMQCTIIDESMAEGDNEANARIRLTIPMISYEHFMRSRCYRYGMTYKEYGVMLKENLVGGRQSYDEIVYRQKVILQSQPKSALPVWNLGRTQEISGFSEKQNLETSLSQGFFNGIPSGAVLMDVSGSEHAYGLVSTAWRDWKTYLLHPAPSNVHERLKTSNISPSSILGYTSGSWTTQDLSRQAAGIRLLVVDAELRFDGKPVNFALNACLYLENSKSLSSYEQRIFCGRLSPTLFRYARPKFDNLVAHLKPSKRLKRKREPDFAFFHGSSTNPESQTQGRAESRMEPYSSDEFWDEMMAREVWDRMVEKQGGGVKSHPDYTRWLESEEQRRITWDKERDVDTICFKVE